MPKTAKQMEKIILNDGWILEKTNHGSHRKYHHPTKTGKVIIPFHNNDLALKTMISICNQAGLDWRKYK